MKKLSSITYKLKVDIKKQVTNLVTWAIFFGTIG